MEGTIRGQKRKEKKPEGDGTRPLIRKAFSASTDSLRWQETDFDVVSTGNLKGVATKNRSARQGENVRRGGDQEGP